MATETLQFSINDVVIKNIAGGINNNTDVSNSANPIDAQITKKSNYNTGTYFVNGGRISFTCYSHKIWNRDETSSNLNALNFVYIPDQSDSFLSLSFLYKFVTTDDELNLNPNPNEGDFFGLIPDSQSYITKLSATVGGTYELKSDSYAVIERHGTDITIQLVY